jgi:hypothetical protein
MAACWIFLIFDAATICMAFVICAVLLMDLIRRRMSCRLCIIYLIVPLSRPARNASDTME